MSRRSEQLIALVNESIRVHQEWVENDAVQVLTDEYCDAARAMVESFARGDVPAECRALADAVEEFGRHLAEYERPDVIRTTAPGNDFWAAREKIVALLTKTEDKPLTPLEPFAVQVAKGVPHLTIAKQYGLRDRHGNWLPHLVQQELDQPGSVLKTPGAIDGRDWIDPRIAERQAKQAGADEHLAALAQKVEARTKKQAKPRKPCPETPEELWKQNVPVKQAAVMLCQDEAAVAEMFAKFTQDRDDAIASGDTVPVDAQAVQELFREGMSPGDIATGLNMSKRKVLEIVGRMAKEKAAVPEGAEA